MIGAGSGGYIIAIHAAQLDKKVAVVEGFNTEDTCSNIDCVPSKTLLEYGGETRSIQVANNWGMTAKELNTDFSKFV